MSTSNEILNNYMTNKNKEALGEKVKSEAKADDNFLADPEKTMNTFKGESSSNSDNGLLMARRIMNTFLTIPILIGGIFSAFYLVLKLGPAILRFIKSLLFNMWL